MSFSWNYLTNEFKYNKIYHNILYYFYPIQVNRIKNNKYIDKIYWIQRKIMIEISQPS